MHIYAGADEEKPDIGEEKPDIGEEKPDIDIAEQFKIAADSFSGKTISHMQKLFANYGAGIIFGRSDVMDLLGIKKSGASELLRKMLKAGMLEAVSGHGKGRYRFKNP